MSLCIKEAFTITEYKEYINYNKLHFTFSKFLCMCLKFVVIKRQKLKFSSFTKDEYEIIYTNSKILDL